MNHMEDDVSNRTRNSQSDGIQEREFDMTKCTGGRARFYGDHYGETNPNGKKRECVACIANNFGKYEWKKMDKVRVNVKLEKAPKKPRNWCPRCGIHLCIGKCFQDYHTKSLEHLDHGL